jgi:ATP-dependent Clp protease adaptor protein ClpS
MTNSASEPGRQEDAAVRERSSTRTPRRFRVLLHNDDFTPMEFVVDVLQAHFGKSVTEATRIMLEVHHAGVGCAGAFTRDVAETLVAEVMDEASEAGFPLLLSAEPE